jgi:uncharacterized protein
MQINKNLLLILFTIILFSFLAQQSFAQDNHKIVIQVSTDDPRTQKIALNNAVNLQKHYGMDNIEIEIVAYGPGLGLLTSKSQQGKRVSSLAIQDITFSACGNTMKKVAKKTGKMPKLLEGVEQVSSGIARVMELQEQGFAYVRP